MNAPTIFSCPNEIRQAILMYLSIDPATLRTLIFSSQTLFSHLLQNTKFARLHIKFQYKASQESDDLWEFLNTEQLRGEKWSSLPFAYKVSLFREILLEPNWKRVFEVTDLTTNLMCYSRWRMPPHTAFRVVTQLLIEGFPIQSQENRCFRWSSRSGYFKVVQLLLAHPDVDPTDQKHYAIASTPDTEYLDVVQLLLSDSRIDPTAQQNLCMRWAADHEHWDTVDLLLKDPRIDPGANDNYLVLSLLNKGKLEKAQDVLARVDPGAGENSVIRTAADCGHDGIVEMLLKDERVDPAAEDSSALALAAASGRVGCVRLLMEDGRSDPSTFQNHGLRIAATKGFHEVVELLLTDARVNPSVDHGIALRSSVSHGHAKVLEVLLKDNRVDPNVVVSWACLITACEKGFADVVRVILGEPKIVSLDSQIQKGIKKAVEKGHVEVVKVLLEYRGENVPRVPTSLLMRALTLGNVELVDILLDDLALAPPRMRQSKGKTMLQIAFNNHEREFVNLLMKKVFLEDVEVLSEEEVKMRVESRLSDTKT
ncbi:UNVERIFIED_CONTAM: hypothetical protein HDU68_003925 [Siphonaria sp. JEL0065]|nr:hypothetical protein HDU68_003925 [Siphonaria sp. JEL0065]